nr:hypothetical protein [Actinomycetota bacterium]
VYDALLGEEPILEVAADYDAAVFENDWDRLKGFTRFSDWDREDFETRMPQSQRRGSEINRVVEDDRLILELLYENEKLPEGTIERRYYEPVEDDVFLESFRDDESPVGTLVRGYYERRDPDSHLVRVLGEFELPGEEPRVAYGSYVEVYKEGDKWDVRPRGLFFTDEEKERFYGKPVPD